MIRKFTSFPVNNFSDLKYKMLNWLKQFSIFCLLDNNEYDFKNPAFECLIGAGAIDIFETTSDRALEEFDSFKNGAKDWIFGHLSYDLKNKIESLSSENYDGVGFPDIFFFIPRIVIILNENELKIGVLNENAEDIYKSFLALSNSLEVCTSRIGLKQRFSKAEYSLVVEKLKQHILRGDCYEINFCQEFYSEDGIIDPFLVYNNLSQLSPNPFSAFYKVNDKFLLCASPERFLKRQDDTLISQPIKGTSVRMTNESEDAGSKLELLTSKKERSENVMIVDLVRNDLSKVCKEDTVKVDELFGIYSFPQVHQMISTISGTVSSTALFSDIIKATFPMGSMTGAPKKRVMELIEQYEKTKRGLFSGAVGYITPEGDFDFNVVIRSILYNETKKYLSIQVGSAITFLSDAEKEYEECLAKIIAIKKVLE